MNQTGRSPIAFLLTSGVLLGLICLPFGGFIWSLIKEFTEASEREAYAMSAPPPAESPSGTTPGPNSGASPTANRSGTEFPIIVSSSDEVLITRSVGAWLFLQMNADGTTSSAVFGLGLNPPVLRSTRLECPLPDKRSIYVPKMSRHVLRVVTSAGVQSCTLLSGRESLRNVAMHVLVNKVKIGDQLRILIGKNAMEALN